jgi:hypothetical protein
VSLVSYIPKREATLKHGGKDMPVIGIKGFTMEIERLKATYEIWVNINDATSIIAASDNAVTSAISLVPTDMNEPAAFAIDDKTVACVVKHYAYHSIKHAYLMKIEFPLMKDQVKTYIFEKENENDREQTRFDILDL